MSLRLALQDRHDPVRGFRRRHIRRIDFVDEGQVRHRLLEDHINRLGLDVLVNLFRSPPSGPQPLPKHGRAAPEDDRDIHAHAMGEVRTKEGDLRGDVQPVSKRFDVDLIGLADRVAPGDEAVPPGDLVEIDDGVPAPGQHLAGGRFPRARRPGDRDEHGGTKVAGTISFPALHHRSLAFLRFGSADLYRRSHEGGIERAARANRPLRRAKPMRPTNRSTKKAMTRTGRPKCRTNATTASGNTIVMPIANGERAKVVATRITNGIAANACRTTGTSSSEARPARNAGRTRTRKRTPADGSLSGGYVTVGKTPWKTA